MHPPAKCKHQQNTVLSIWSRGKQGPVKTNVHFITQNVFNTTNSKPPTVTFPNVGKVLFLSTRKLLVTNLSWARGFGIEFSFLSRSSKVTMFFWNVFGLALRKAVDSCRHDLDGSPRFGATAHRHQVPFGILFQAGWFLAYSPLELWFITTPL